MNPSDTDPSALQAADAAVQEAPPKPPTKRRTRAASPAPAVGEQEAAATGDVAKANQEALFAQPGADDAASMDQPAAGDDIVAQVEHADTQAKDDAGQISRGFRRRQLAPVAPLPLERADYYGETTKIQAPDDLGATVDVRTVLGLRYQAAVTTFTVPMHSTVVQKVWQRDGKWATRVLARVENAYYTRGLAPEDIDKLHEILAANLARSQTVLADMEQQIGILLGSSPVPSTMRTRFPQPINVEALIVSPHMVRWLEILQQVDRILINLTQAYHLGLMSVSLRLQQERNLRKIHRSFLEALRPMRLRLTRLQEEYARHQIRIADKVAGDMPEEAAKLRQEAAEDIREAGAEAAAMLKDHAADLVGSMLSGEDGGAGPAMDQSQIAQMRRLAADSGAMNGISNSPQDANASLAPSA